MSYNGTSFLTNVNGHLNGAGYINVLENSAIPSAHLLGFGDDFWFQDDGAPCHRSRLVAEWKAENNLSCLSWPPQSPDLNPIENVWRNVKLGLKQLRPRNLQELEDNACNIWNNFPIRKCHKIYAQKCTSSDGCKMRVYKVLNGTELKELNCVCN